MMSSQTFRVLTRASSLMKIRLLSIPPQLSTLNVLTTTISIGTTIREEEVDQALTEADEATQAEEEVSPSKTTMPVLVRDQHVRFVVE